MLPVGKWIGKKYQDWKPGTGSKQASKQASEQARDEAQKLLSACLLEYYLSGWSFFLLRA
jgi:hypothetical protein